MVKNPENFQKQVVNWMFPIEQSIKELRDLIRSDVKKAVSEALLNSKITKDQLAEDITGTDYLTIDQAIELLHVSKPTLHRYRKENAVGVSQVGRRVLFKKSDLIEAIKIKPKTKGGRYLVN